MVETVDAQLQRTRGTLLHMPYNICTRYFLTRSTHARLCPAQDMRMSPGYGQSCRMRPVILWHARFAVCVHEKSLPVSDAYGVH